MAIDRAGTMVETDNLAEPALSILCALVLSVTGAWCALRAIAFADGRELLAFGALAFACGLLKLNTATTSPLSRIRLSTAATVASIPFLGPAASIPAMLATLAETATSGDVHVGSPRAIFDSLRVPAAALAGGTAYALMAGRLAGPMTTLSIQPFVIAISAFVLVDMTIRLLAGDTEWGSRYTVFASLSAAAGGWMIAMWRQFCPSQILLTTAAVIAGMWATAVLVAREPVPVDSTTESDHAVQVENNAEEERLSLVDPLTGLANERYLYMFLHQEIGRSVRKNLPVSLVLLDLDDFQSVNTEHGSEASDAAMVEVGRLLKACVREYDIVARYSSDEFAVVLPEAKCSDACERAEKIRDMVAQHSFNGSIKLSVSAGVSTYPEHGMTTDDLVSSAHHALNRAKFAGKDRVTSCTEIIGKLRYGT